jgi:hypothetical protein
MATRRAKPRKTGRKPAARKSSSRPSKARKKAASRRIAARPTKPAARAAAKASPKTAKPRAAAGSGLLALARKIVRATRNPQHFDLRDLYAEGAVSREASGAIATGFAELEAKLTGWNSMQERTEWNPRKVFAEGDSICIEWDATVWMRDGRVVPLSEVAVHEVRDGKIVSERYYYNPLALAPQAS